MNQTSRFLPNLMKFAENKFRPVLGTTRSYDIELRTVGKLVKNATFLQQALNFCCPQCRMPRGTSLQICAFFACWGTGRIFFRDEKNFFSRAEKRYLGVFQHSNDSHRVSFHSRCCFSHEFFDFSSQKVAKNSVFSNFFQNL